MQLNVMGHIYTHNTLDLCFLMFRLSLNAQTLNLAIQISFTQSPT